MYQDKEFRNNVNTTEEDTSRDPVLEEISEIYDNGRRAETLYQATGKSLDKRLRFAHIQKLIS